MGQVLPGRLDFESYAGDDFAVILAFTTAGAAYTVTAADFSASITRASGDVTIGITQESASSLRLAITDTNLGSSLSQDRWVLRHTATDRTWLAGDFVVSLSKRSGGGVTQANVIVDTATYTVAIDSVATVPGGAVGAAADVSIADAGGYYTGTTVEAALQEAAVDTAAVQTNLTAHLNDASDAHDASAISILDTAARYTATDVEAALAEVKAVADAAVKAVAVEDEGVEILATASRFDFVGAGVTATDAGSGQATITIPGGSSTPSTGSRSSNSFSYSTDMAAGTSATIHTVAAIVPTVATLYQITANGTVYGVTGSSATAGIVTIKAAINGGAAVDLGYARWHTNGAERQVQVSTTGLVSVAAGASVVFTVVGANDAGSAQAVDHLDWYRFITPVTFA